MLENLYTTKMSMDKKNLQNRFTKIRLKNGKLSRAFAVIIFVLLIAVIAFISVYIAFTQNNYTMSDADLGIYTSRPIGAIMAELDYADSDKVVFHYFNGFFITNEQTGEIEHKIDLGKLNIAPHTQGDTILMIKVDKDGKFAYLSSEGMHRERFDEYIISLDSGEVKKGAMPENTELFAEYIDTYTINTHGGMPSDKAVRNNNKTYYLLYRQYEALGNIELVTIDHNSASAEDTTIRYLFGKECRIEMNMPTEEALFRSALEKGEEMLEYRLDSWNAGAEKVRQITDKLSEILNMKKIKVKDGIYKVIACPTELKGNGCQRLIIIDTENGELLFTARLDLTGYAGMKEYYGELFELLEENDTATALYSKTAAYLEENFHKTYDDIYDIQRLTISDWKENGDEATFIYTMEYLNYNRDPDKAEYIQEAKKRSQKEYETLYNDYLALMDCTYQFKSVLEGNELKLLTTVNPHETEWIPVEFDDFRIDR